MQDKSNPAERLSNRKPKKWAKKPTAKPQEGSADSTATPPTRANSFYPRTV